MARRARAAALACATHPRADAGRRALHHGNYPKPRADAGRRSVAFAGTRHPRTRAPGRSLGKVNPHPRGLGARPPGPDAPASVAALRYRRTQRGRRGVEIELELPRFGRRLEPYLPNARL